MAKTAHKPQMAAKEVPALTREQMIAEVRNLRAGKLFVGNMELVDALLEAYDEARSELRVAHTQTEANEILLRQAMQDAAEHGVFTEIKRGPAVQDGEVAEMGAEG